MTNRNTLPQPRRWEGDRYGDETGQRSELELAQAFILLLQTLHLLELVRAHAAVLLAPAVIRLLGDTHLADRINARLALPHKHVNLK